MRAARAAAVLALHRERDDEARAARERLSAGRRTVARAGAAAPTLTGSRASVREPCWRRSGPRQAREQRTASGTPRRRAAAVRRRGPLSAASSPAAGGREPAPASGGVAGSGGRPSPPGGGGSSPGGRLARPGRRLDDDRASERADVAGGVGRGRLEAVLAGRQRALEAARRRRSAPHRPSGRGASAARRRRRRPCRRPGRRGGARRRPGRRASATARSRRPSSRARPSWCCRPGR